MTKLPYISPPKRWAVKKTEADKKPAVDTASFTEFPLLGSSSVAPKVTTVPNKQSFAIKVAAMAEAEKERQAREAAEAAIRGINPHHYQTYKQRMSNIGTRCFDDGPDDYEPPSEDEDDAYYRAIEARELATNGQQPSQEYYEDEDDTNNTTDDISTTRRRGDHGFW